MKKLIYGILGVFLFPAHLIYADKDLQDTIYADALRYLGRKAVNEGVAEK